LADTKGETENWQH